MNASAAYVAGLIDGEGCIHIEKSRATYRARVTLGMSAPARGLLEEMKSQWGGVMYQMRPATKRWAAAYQWYVWGDSASELLRYILPYLKLKRRQAEIGLAVEAVRNALPRRQNGNALWDSAAREECEGLKQKMHQLNKKGPRAQNVEPPAKDWPTAVWNPSRDCWEASQVDLLSGLPAVYVETWPASGSMRNGRLYVRPTSEPHTGEPVSSSLLPTPSASIGSGGASDPDQRKLKGHAPRLHDVIEHL